MKKSTKMFMGILGLCLAALISMAGCKKAFDASGYVEAILDLTTKSDTDPIKKYVQDSDKLAELKAFAAEEQEKIADAGFNRYEVSQNVQKKWEELIQELLKNSKYTVEKAEKTESGYEVKVNIEPISGIFDDLETPVREGCELYLKENKEDVINGTLIDIDILNEIREIYIDAVRGNMEKLSYGDAQTITVKLSEGEGLAFSGIEKAGGLLIDMSGFEDIDLWEIWEDITSFDAAGFVKAALDFYTKGDTDTIKEYLDDEDDLKNFDEKYMSSSFIEDYKGLGISEDVLRELEDLYQQVLKKTRYTVEDAEKSWTNYTVKVSIEPVAGIFDDIWEQMEGQAAAYGEENAERIADGTITDEEVYSALCSMLVEDAKGNIGNIHYKDASETTVNVRPKGSSYTIDEFDLGMVYLMLVDMSGLEGIF